MVQLFSNIKYYKEAQIELVLFPASAKAKLAKEATVAFLSSLLDLGISGAMGMGTSALVLQDTK